ncbi:RloB domain-containing protein [Pseudomonas sp. WS 5411]|uniref:RloB family protein n=1 Tax=Pseudomonas sp. WS 5411 TaxID=2717486 RepID=UPI0014737FBF|nr:RloB family protein [Pseudomonas sp. WS 5411]NMY86094.1 RloB domain-containing protein [Pseudomonas sp. WS 5411]
MARTADSFRRKESRFRQLPTVLVLCEDLKSGKTYLEDAALHFRANAKVEIAHCGVTHPKGIVEHAIGRQSKFDKVFCAFDRDTHESFDEALRLADTHPKITIIASYPCFEFWLLLHFGYSRKPFARSGRHSAGDLVSIDLKEKPGMENYRKSGAAGYFQKLLGEPFNEARRQAPRVIADVARSGDPNPSTQIHLLIDEFEQLAKPLEIIAIG